MIANETKAEFDKITLLRFEKARTNLASRQAKVEVNPKLVQLSIMDIYKVVKVYHRLKWT